MMASSFSLILDTTGPDIEISVPHYTFRNVLTDVLIHASEDLGSFQDIKLIDQFGTTYPLTLARNGNTLQGSFFFNRVSVGSAKIVAQVVDDVGNLSPVVEKYFVIFDQVALAVTPEIFGREVVLSKDRRLAEIQGISRGIFVEPISRDISMENSNRRIEVEK